MDSLCVSEDLNDIYQYFFLHIKIHYLSMEWNLYFSYKKHKIFFETGNFKIGDSYKKIWFFVRRTIITLIYIIKYKNILG